MMKQKYYNLNVGAQDLEEKIKLAVRLGWDGVCIVEDFGPDFKLFSQKIGDIKEDLRENEKPNLDILTGAKISPKLPQDIQKKSRDALKHADLILVGGGDENINRAASECWEVDVLTRPQILGKDFMDQKNSGIDHITSRFMAERCIALEIDFSGILNSWGIRRSQMMGKIRQNVMLARKYQVPAIITSGAGDKWSLRAPRELMAIGVSLGMSEGDAKRAVGENPVRVIKKSRDRKNPDVIMKGLEVVEWGDFKPEGEKRMFGWY